MHRLGIVYSNQSTTTNKVTFQFYKLNNLSYTLLSGRGCVHCPMTGCDWCSNFILHLIRPLLLIHCHIGFIVGLIFVSEVNLWHLLTPSMLALYFHRIFANFFLSILACGQTLQESSGTFSAPVKSDSLAQQRCQWRISATHGEKIVLKVTELDILKSPNCETDYLEVRDGHWLKSSLLGNNIIIIVYIEKAEYQHITLYLDYESYLSLDI